jgi:hypothetical protein
MDVLKDGREIGDAARDETEASESGVLGNDRIDSVMRSIGLDLGARHIAYCEVRDGEVVDRSEKGLQRGFGKREPYAQSTDRYLCAIFGGPNPRAV